MALRVKEYATPANCKKAFDSDLAKKGVLPVLVQVQNNSTTTYEVKPESARVEGKLPLKRLSAKEAAKKIKRDAVGPAVGLSLIVPIIAIPVAAATSVSHTNKINKQIEQDFVAKDFHGGIVKPNNDVSGFLFFELEKDRKDLSGLEIKISAVNVDTGKTVELSTALPPANFTRKKAVNDEQKM